MRRKIVSPKSIQKITVLNREHGPLVIHKRRAKDKLPKNVRKFLKHDPFRETTNAIRDMTGAVRIAKGVAGVARTLGGFSPPMPTLKVGW